MGPAFENRMIVGETAVSKQWKELSVLVVGCGSIGKRHARVLSALGLQDIRVSDLRCEARNELIFQVPMARQYASYEAGLADKPDAVFICTPPQMHIPMAIEAVKSGIHVMCEKPLSNSTEGIDELAKLVKQTQIKVMVGLCFRYHEGIRKSYEYLRSERVGRVVCLRALVGEYLPETRPDYRSVESMQSLGAFDLMHDLDLVLWMAKQPVKEVYCVSGNYSNVDIEAPDLVELLINFKGLCAASVHLDFFQRPRRRQLELICTEGLILVEFSQWDVCTVSLYDGQKGLWRHEKLETERDNMFKAEDREFLRAIAEGYPIKCTIEEGRKSLEVIEVAQRNKKGRMDSTFSCY